MKSEWTPSEVREMLSKNPLAVEGAVCRLAVEQELAERRQHASLFRNLRGFCKQDGGRFMLWAEQVWSGESLSSEQIDFARPRMMKYARQLSRWFNYDMEDSGVA